MSAKQKRAAGFNCRDQYCVRQHVYISFFAGAVSYIFYSVSIADDLKDIFTLLFTMILVFSPAALCLTTSIYFVVQNSTSHLFGLSVEKTHDDRRSPLRGVGYSIALIAISAFVLQILAPTYNLNGGYGLVIADRIETSISRLDLSTDKVIAMTISGIVHMIVVAMSANCVGARA